MYFLPYYEEGDLYYTYETMDETGIPSYSIADNPEYKVAIAAQMTAENSKNSFKKLKAGLKFETKLKAGLFGLTGIKKAPKTEMNSKYVVAESYQHKLEEGGHSKS